MRAITKREYECYEFVRDFVREHKRSPSYAEIAAGLETHKGNAHRLVERLIAHGILAKDSYAPFSLQVLR